MKDYHVEISYTDAAQIISNVIADRMNESGNPLTPGASISYTFVDEYSGGKERRDENGTPNVTLREIE